MSDVRIGSEGPRGPRGHRGPTGPTGATGPMGATVSGAPVVVPFVNGNAGTLAPGTPIYASAPGTGDKAEANAAATALAIGLVLAAVLPGATGIAVLRGPLTLTTAQRDAIAGTVGGLAFGVPYYVSATTPGTLTSSPPAPGSGFFVTPAVVGFSPTVGIVWPALPQGPV